MWHCGKTHLSSHSVFSLPPQVLMCSARHGCGVCGVGLIFFFFKLMTFEASLLLGVSPGQLCLFCLLQSSALSCGTNEAPPAFRSTDEFNKGLGESVKPRLPCGTCSPGLVRLSLPYRSLIDPLSLPYRSVYLRGWERPQQRGHRWRCLGEKWDLPLFHCSLKHEMPIF